jgi:hypothetical protein
MHPFKIGSVLVIVFCISSFAKAQDGTIKVQRNPAPLDSTIKCGGVLRGSHITIELSSFQPLHQPAEVFYVPKNYSVNDFIMQNGFGAHLILSSYHSQLNYSRRGSLGLSFVTGFDHFFGKQGDSSTSQTSSALAHYKYSFNMIPLNLRLGVSLINRTKFFMSMVIDGGENLLLTKFSWTPNSFSNTSRVPSYGGGFNFCFLLRGYRTLGLTFKTEHIDKNWFREVSLIFPVYYGKPKRPAPIRVNDPRPF